MTGFDIESADRHPVPLEAPDGQFLLDLDGYEGPIDVLLGLAREQKVDLTHISILALADQYLGFVERMRRLRLEMAADYLVMAAWLAYLKSRLLIPEPDPEDEEPSGEELVDAFKFQLLRLDAVRDAGQKLVQRPQLGVMRFARGDDEKIAAIVRPVLHVSLHDLLGAYGAIAGRNRDSSYHISQTTLYSVEDAIRRLRDILGAMPDWSTLASVLPKALDGSIESRSALASTFVASLELAKQGLLEIRQDGAFQPVLLRAPRQDVESPRGE